MTVEFIFSVVTAVFTAILGTITRDKVIPSRFVPIQNIIIGIISAGIAIYMNLFDDWPTAIIVSLGMTLGAGGGYDAIRIKAKSEELSKKTIEEEITKIKENDEVVGDTSEVYNEDEKEVR